MVFNLMNALREDWGIEKGMWWQRIALKATTETNRRLVMAGDSWTKKMKEWQDRALDRTNQTDTVKLIDHYTMTADA